MATTYKFLASEVETLTANVFADQVEIYDGHPLDECTEYVWFYDPLDIDGNPTTATQVQPTLNADGTHTPMRIGDGGNTYDVDLSDVVNSGEYYCEIRVGQTQDCWIATERRRISIIECLDQTNRTFTATGASGTFRLRHPHYETPVFSNEGNTWIIEGEFNICDTQTNHVCLTVQNFTLADQVASANSARRGQPTITVGPLVCYYNTVQDYIPAAADPVVPDVPNGPFISLAQNGPATIGNVTVTATVGTIGGDGTETYTVDWSDDRGGEQEDTLTYLVGNPDGFGIGDTVVTATVTDNNNLTARATITVTHEQIRLFATSVTGDIIGQLGSITIWNQPPITTTSGTITVSGGGVFFARMLIVPVGYLQGGEAGNFQATLTINGPGANRTEVINSTGVDTATREIEFNGNGTYTWSYAWTDGISRPTGGQSIQPSASVLFAAQLF